MRPSSTPHRAPRPHLLAGSDLDRPDVLDLDRVDRQPARAGAEGDRPGIAGLLQARRDVHGLAGGERRGDVFDHELTRFDPDPHVEVEVADGIEHGERCPDGALGVVLVRLRHAERRHHGVAGELLDGAAVQLDLLGAPVEVAVTRRRTTSGSLTPSNDVESTRSTKRTVASLRSMMGL